MLEKLNSPKILLYERVLDVGYGYDHWRVIKRFGKYPQDLDSWAGPLRVLSPEFNYYLDINRETNLFMIRETMTQNKVCDISGDYMNASTQTLD